MTKNASGFLVDSIIWVNQAVDHIWRKNSTRFQDINISTIVYKHISIIVSLFR